ncbi:MAG: tripartite tricarboxylate transporter substrate binding protein, partial [Pseudomonas sp.]|nr:tripartite tricarboxylate transporter substrate binding protein [Pseudomonas sp.]
MKRRILLQSVLASAALAPILGTSAAWAQDKWPSKPISYVVPFPAGGTTDILGRLIGQKLGTALGTTIVI